MPKMPKYKEITQAARGENKRDYNTIKKAGGFNNWAPYDDAKKWTLDHRRAFVKMLCLVDVGNLVDHKLLGPFITEEMGKTTRMTLPETWMQWTDEYVKIKKKEDQEKYIKEKKRSAAFEAKDDVRMYIQASACSTRPTVSTTVADGTKGSSIFLIDMQSEAAIKAKNAVKMVHKEWSAAIPNIPKNAGLLQKGSSALYLESTAKDLASAEHIAIHLADNSVDELSWITAIPIEWISEVKEAKLTKNVLY